MTNMRNSTSEPVPNTVSLGSTASILTSPNSPTIPPTYVMDRSYSIHVERAVRSSGPDPVGAIESDSTTANEQTQQRDQWPSRTAFILAGMGSAMGVGNILRFPSVTAKNYGLQWFIPYGIAIPTIAMPILLLEIALGRATKGASALALRKVSGSPRWSGPGLASVVSAFGICTFYSVILAWCMTYFRYSMGWLLTQDKTPWQGRSEDFFHYDVLKLAHKDDPTDSDGMPWELLGWSAMIWFISYAVICKGVGVTGKLIYVTMALPMVLMVIVTVRGVTLENAWSGIKNYVGVFRTDKLFDGGMWSSAIGQIFFSTGTGVGVYTAYASYTSAHQNAVQDALIISSSNSIFEVFVAFGTFGAMGALGLFAQNSESLAKDLDELSSFGVGFFTYPDALSKLPLPNLWAAVFFFVLVMLGLSSMFALLEGAVTTLVDSTFLKTRFRPPRWLTVLFVCITGYLISIAYTTPGGFHRLNSLDIFLNEVAVVFASWIQILLATTLYRWRDLANVIGYKSFYLSLIAYIGSLVIGSLVGSMCRKQDGAVWIGFGTGIGILVTFTIASMIAAVKHLGGPNVNPDNTCWEKEQKKDLCAMLKGGRKERIVKAWWLITSYSGRQLTNDLNIFVGDGSNWSIPGIWAPTLRYIASPILFVTFTFGLNKLYDKGIEAHAEPTPKNMAIIYAAVVTGLILLIAASGWISKRWINGLLPPPPTSKDVDSSEKATFTPLWEDAKAKLAESAVRNMDQWDKVVKEGKV